jgi:hypothetical protein
MNRHGGRPLVLGRPLRRKPAGERCPGGDYLRRQAELDKEIRRINSSAPLGSSRRLREVELIARDIPSWGSSVPIEKLLKLPQLVVGNSAQAPLLWPPVQHLNLGLLSLFPQNGNVMRDPGTCLGFEMREVDGAMVVCETGKPPPSMVPDQPLHRRPRSWRRERQS